MKPLPQFVHGLLLIISAVAATGVRAEPAGTPIDHPLFDANHCLSDILPSREAGAVEFHWGCPKNNLITISCVFDRTGYLGLGPEYARPGWHCNHPLPVLADDSGRRVSDVAVSEPSGRPVWAACAVPDLGDFASREKPYHATPCYRAMIEIATTVNRTGRDPRAVAAEVLP